MVKLTEDTIQISKELLTDIANRGLITKGEKQQILDDYVKARKWDEREKIPRVIITDSPIEIETFPPKKEIEQNQKIVDRIKTGNKRWQLAEIEDILNEGSKN